MNLKVTYSATPGSKLFLILHVKVFTPATVPKIDNTSPTEHSHVFSRFYY